MKKVTRKKISKSLKEYWQKIHKIQKKLKTRAKFARKIYKHKDIIREIKKRKWIVKRKERGILIRELKKLNIKPDSIIGQKMIKQGLGEIVRRRVEKELSKQKRFRYLRNKVYDYKNKKWITRKEAERIKKRLRRKIRIREAMEKYDISYDEARDFVDFGFVIYKFMWGYQ